MVWVLGLALLAVPASGDTRREMYSSLFVQTRASEGTTPSPRMNSLMLTRGTDSLYMFGGMDSQQQVLDDFWRFDTKEHKWTELMAEDGAGNRVWSSAVVDPAGKFMWMFGGFDGSQNLNDLWRYDFIKKRWQLITAKSDVPLPRDRHSMVMVANNIFVYGGYTTTFSDQFWQYDSELNEWSEVQASAPSSEGPGKRRSHAACVHLDRMYLLGGQSTGGTILHDVWAFDFGLTEWSSVGFPVERTQSMIVSDGLTKTIVFGGFDGDNYKYDLWMKDGDDDWETMSPNGDRPVERSDHAGALQRDRRTTKDKGRIYVFGGFDGKSVLGDMHKFDLMTSTWSVVHTSSPS